MIPVPTARLAVVAVAAAALAAVSPWGLLATAIAVNLVVLALFVVDAAAAPDPRSVHLSRRLPGLATVGSAVTVGWRVAHDGDRRLRLWFADELAPSLGADRRRFRVELPPRGSADVTIELRPRRRGAFVVGELVVRVDGPLGLATRQRSRRAPQLLRVHPRFRSREGAELRMQRSRMLEVGLRSTRGRGGGTDFDQLREYRPDDEYRRIDWAATARRGEPVVRTYRAERNQTIAVVVDNGRVMTGRVEGVPRVEHSFDAVMTLTAVATHLGDKVGLVAFDRDVRAVVAPAAGRRQLGTITEALFDLEPSLHESDYRGAFMTTLARFRRRSLLVLCTDLVEQAVGETLLPALPMLVSSHVVVVVAVTDPEVLDWASSRPDGVVEVYRQAAAIETLADRRRAAARMEALGVVVIDEPPATVAAVLADAYLGIKATGRL